MKQLPKGLWVDDLEQMDNSLWSRSFELWKCRLARGEKRIYLA